MKHAPECISIHLDSTLATFLSDEKADSALLNFHSQKTSSLSWGLRIGHCASHSSVTSISKNSHWHALWTLNGTAFKAIAQSRFPLKMLQWNTPHFLKTNVNGGNAFGSYSSSELWRISHVCGSSRTSQVRPSSPSLMRAYSARFSAIWQSLRAEYVEPSCGCPVATWGRG